MARSFWLDGFTGPVMPGGVLSDGASTRPIEAKGRAPENPPRERQLSRASTFQKLLPPLRTSWAAMTGQHAATEAEEVPDDLRPRRVEGCGPTSPSPAPTRTETRSTVPARRRFDPIGPAKIRKGPTRRASPVLVGNHLDRERSRVSQAGLRQGREGFAQQAVLQRPASTSRKARIVAEREKPGAVTIATLTWPGAHRHPAGRQTWR